MERKQPNKALLMLGALVVVVAGVFHVSSGIFHSGSNTQSSAFEAGDILRLWQEEPDNSDVLVFTDREMVVLYARKVNAGKIEETDKILKNENAWFVKGGTRCEYIGGDYKLAEVTLINGQHAGKSCVVYKENLFLP